MKLNSSQINIIQCHKRLSSSILSWSVSSPTVYSRISWSQPISFQRKSLVKDFKWTYQIELRGCEALSTYLENVDFERTQNNWKQIMWNSLPPSFRRFNATFVKLMQGITKLTYRWLRPDANEESPMNLTLYNVWLSGDKQMAYMKEMRCYFMNDR